MSLLTTCVVRWSSLLHLYFITLVMQAVPASLFSEGIQGDTSSIINLLQIMKALEKKITPTLFIFYGIFLVDSDELLIEWLSISMETYKEYIFSLKLHKKVFQARYTLCQLLLAFYASVYIYFNWLLFLAFYFQNFLAGANLTSIYFCFSNTGFLF